MFLKQNAATFSAKKESLAHFSAVELIVLERRTESLGNCTETVSKTTKTSFFEKLRSIRGNSFLQIELIS